MRKIHVVYVALCRRDVRLARICIASIRYFYPTVPIRLLCGEQLSKSTLQEFKRLWNVHPADLPKMNWGWGLAKIESLFINPGSNFLVLDADTVITGKVFDLWHSSSCDFLVNLEHESRRSINRLYYNWREVKAVDASAAPPRFVFNSGQWFGTSGLLSRNDFQDWIKWTDGSPQLIYPKMFMPGDQGVLNYVFNKACLSGRIKVDTKEIMLWPPKSSCPLTIDIIANRNETPKIIHWAGVKKPLLRAMLGFPLLSFFERYYYSNMSWGVFILHLRGLFSAILSCYEILSLPFRLKLKHGFKITRD